MACTFRLAETICCRTFWPNRPLLFDSENIGGPATGSDDGVVGRGDDVDDCGADRVGPSDGQGNVPRGSILQWQASRISLFSRRQEFSKRHGAVRNPCVFGKCAGTKRAGPGHCCGCSGHQRLARPLVHSDHNEIRRSQAYNVGTSDRPDVIDIIIDWIV